MLKHEFEVLKQQKKHLMNENEVGENHEITLNCVYHFNAAYNAANTAMQIFTEYHNIHQL